MFLSSSLVFTLSFLILHIAAWDCTSLTSLSLPNVTITDANHLVAGSTFNASADPTCFMPTYKNTVEICRVVGAVATSPTSTVKFEMWLPETWYGRVLTGGNGGLGGCIEYSILDHASSLHFAAIGTNNGHDGSLTPDPFLNPSRMESLKDFSYRAVHVAALLGYQIASVYYGASPHHSYYNGCSAGGRQGISVASRYPDLFDGILVGSPALDWNRFLGATEVWASFVATNTSRAIPLPQWSAVVTPEILRQCDLLDGRMDGIIADPSLCSWNPETLLCRPEDNVADCLSRDQVDGLKKFYRPILGTNGGAVAPAFDAGAEGDLSLPFPMNGIIPTIAAIWYNYAIYGQPTRPTGFLTVADLEYADTIDPAGISTWANAIDGLGKLRDKGGKVITFHGTRDPAVPSAYSKNFHELLSSRIASSGRIITTFTETGCLIPVWHADSTRFAGTCGLDEFYRLFTIPGMGHCVGGPGAWRIGQGSINGTLTNTLNQTDHSLLLSLVEWVEGGRAPDFVFGVDNEGNQRKHCLWPSAKSLWDGMDWDCVPA